MDDFKNFAYSTVLTAPSPATSGTSLVLPFGHGTLFPVPPFQATVWAALQIPIAANAEIVRVTARVGDVFTILRAQEGTSVRPILTGDQIAATMTEKMVDDILAAGATLPAGSLPVGGTTGQVLAKTSTLDYATTWADPTGGGGGGAYTRTTATVTTASLVAGTGESGTVTLAKSYRLFSITMNRPARVRLYTTAAKRDADVNRPIGTYPSGDHGLVLEFIGLSTLLSAELSPLVDGTDGKATPDGVIPYRITNTDTATGTVVTTFSWLREE